MTLLDGKYASAHLKQSIAGEVKQLAAAGKPIPHLAAILVGHDGGSETYVASKVRSCDEVGFHSTLIRYEDTVSEDELLAKVREINQDPAIHGLIVQLPLPKHISVEKVTETIAPEKDVDGFHPINVGRMAKGLPAYVSATPNGILKLLQIYNIETEGKHCVVIGRSHIVGSPMSILMARNLSPGNCTVTLTHSKTKDLPAITRQGDIVIVAMGRAHFLKADMVKPGAVVIDVGMNRVPDASKKSGFALLGDVKFDEVAPRCSYITPVPGGVGLMTIASLLENTLKAAKKEIFS